MRSGILFLSIYIFAGLSLTAQTGVSVENRKAKLMQLLIDAKTAGAFGNYEKARQIYLEALKVDPECGACYYESALIYKKAGRLELAFENARSAYFSDSLNSWYSLLYAELCYQNNQLDMSESLYRRLIKTRHDSPEIWSSLATSYEDQGRFENALGVLDSMDMRFGVRDENAYRRYNIHIQTGEAEKALCEALILAGNNSEDPRFAALLADTYAFLDNDDEALDAYESALAIDKEFPPALLGKAELLRKKGRFDKYFKALQEYVGIKSIDPKAQSEYLTLIINIPGFAEYFKTDLDTIFAITSYTYPNSTDLLFTQASYFARTGRDRQALPLLNRIVVMDETDMKAWSGLLSLEYNMKMWNELEKSSGKAISLFPDIPDFYMLRALCFWQQSRLKEAVNTLESSLKKLKPDSIYMTQSYGILGDIYHQWKKEKKGNISYEKSLSIDSDNAIVLNNYAYSLSLKGKDLGKAYELSKRSIELDSGNYVYLDTFAYILYCQGKYAEAKVVFRQALASGGVDSATVLEHYADTLFKLGEYEIAKMYWTQALNKPDCKNRDDINKKLRK